MKGIKKNYINILFSILIVCLLMTSAMALYNDEGWPVENRINGTINGGVFYDCIEWKESTSLTLSTDVPNGTIRYAYLYTGIWGGNKDNTGWMDVNFNGNHTSHDLGPILLQGKNDVNDNVLCSGYGKYWLKYNVTELVNSGQINTATTSKINGSIDGRVYGIVLVVVYEGGDDPKTIQYWINDGSDQLSDGSPEVATDFPGTVNNNNIVKADLMTVHLTGYEPICNDCIKFNNHSMDTSCINTNSFDMHTWNVTDYVEATENNAWFSRGSDPYVSICNAVLIIELEEEEESPPTGTDLNITQMLINPGNVRAEDILRVYVNDNNTISAVIRNNGPDEIIDDFDVCFEADGMDIGCVTVSGGLAGGANTTISIDWTPACADYPVIPGFPPQSLPVTINVTVDNNTENTLSKLIPAMQEFSNYSVIGGMVNKGYVSKNFDCDTDKDPLDMFNHYSLVGGGVEYNINGEKISSFDAQAVDTRNHQIDLPDGVTVCDARLYVYWYDKWGNYEEYPSGCLANLSVNFEGIDILPDAIYQDSKGFGYYQSPKGSTVFNVTSLLSGSGNYTAVVKNIEPEAGNSTTLLGEMLVVVYEGADSSNNTRIWMLEGCDYLMAADETHGSNDYSISPDEATATVSFAGNLDPATVQSARLITVVSQGMDNESDLLFNGNVIKTDAWEASTEISGKINVEDVLLQSDLAVNDNNVGFKDNGTGGMQAVNAILIVCQEEEEEAPPTGTDLNITQMLINPGNERAEDILRVYVNDNNEISAVIRNNGPDEVIDDFDVCFEADGMDIGCVTVSGGLAAGANTTISIDWTPACGDYPVIPGFPPQSLSVTMDCIPECVDDPEVPEPVDDPETPEPVDDPEVPEPVDDPETPGFPPRSLPVTINITVDNNTENTFSKLIPAMQEFSNYSVIGGMVNNGYRSKNFDCDTDKGPLDMFKYCSLVGGGMEYNINGEKISSFDAQAVDTRNHQIDLPDGVTVVDARLYVYWYDKWGNYEEYPSGCLANLSVNFENIDILPDAIYQDSKGFGYYQSLKGSSVFNVTSLVSGSGNYTAVVKNIEPEAGNSTTLLGEMLVVVYEGAGSSNNTRIWMLEGCDYLMAVDKTHGSNDYSVSPDEATATVSFVGNLDPATVQSARLITVVSQGMDNESDLLFNGNVIKTDAWEASTEISGKINVEDVLVQSDMLTGENNMGFKDNGTGGMQAVNAFLLVTTKVSDSGSSSNVVVSG